MNVKILNKIYQTESKQHIEAHHGQGGFILGMQSCFNNWKSINKIHKVNIIIRKNEYLSWCIKLNNCLFKCMIKLLTNWEYKGSSLHAGDYLWKSHG